MEQPKMHELIQPAKELVHQLGNWVLDKILPVDVISEVFNGVQQESAERTVQMFTQPQLPYDDMGNYHDRESL